MQETETEHTIRILKKDTSRMMQKGFKLFIPLADKCHAAQYLCFRGLQRICSVDRVRNEFKQLQGGSVDFKKDEETGIATMLINNPSKGNAFSGKMMIDFADCIQKLENWNSGKCVIIAGAGGTFCSGGYLKSIQSKHFDIEGMVKLMQDTTMRLLNLPLISMAVVEGNAIGGGAELLTACDFRVMKPSAKIGFVQAKLNVATAWGGCTRLVRLLGRTKALQILTSGMIMDANHALQLGFVNAILEESGDVVELGKEWFLKNCAGNTATTRVIKQMVLAAEQCDHDESLRRERQLLYEVWGKKAHYEALSKNIKHK